MIGGNHHSGLDFMLRLLIVALALPAGCAAPAGDVESRVEMLEADRDAFDQRIISLMDRRGLATRGQAEQMRLALTDATRENRNALDRMQRQLDLIESRQKRYEAASGASAEALARRIDEVSRPDGDLPRDLESIRQDYRALYARLDETRLAVFRRMDEQNRRIDEGRRLYRNILENERKFLRDRLTELDHAIETLAQELPPIDTVSPAIKPSAATQAVRQPQHRPGE